MRGRLLKRQLAAFALAGLLLLHSGALATAPSHFLKAGVEAYRQGRVEEAIQYLNRAIALDPEDANARYYLAISLDKLNRPTDALLQYQYVVAHAEDTRVVDYARQRLASIRQTLPEPAADSLKVASAATAAPHARTTAKSFIVPLKGNRNALMVDASLRHDGNSAGGTFIIDTGATYTSISQEMAEQLGLDLAHCEKIRITTANGRIEVPKVTIDHLRVNGLEARNIEATVIPIRPGGSFSGLLGLSFIRQFVLTIDPDNGQLIFQQSP